MRRHVLAQLAAALGLPPPVAPPATKDPFNSDLARRRAINAAAEDARRRRWIPRRRDWLR